MRNLENQNSVTVTGPQYLMRHPLCSDVPTAHTKQKTVSRNISMHLYTNLLFDPLRVLNRPPTLTNVRHILTALFNVQKINNPRVVDKISSNYYGEHKIVPTACRSHAGQTSFQTRAVGHTATQHRKNLVLRIISHTGLGTLAKAAFGKFALDASCEHFGWFHRQTQPFDARGKLFGRRRKQGHVAVPQSDSGSGLAVSDELRNNLPNFDVWSSHAV